MAHRLLIHTLPPLMSIAALFFSLQATGQTLIARVDRNLYDTSKPDPRLTDNIEPPQFLVPQRPLPNVNWKWSIETLKPLYERYSGPDQVPTDVLLDAIPVYDVEKGTIGFSFADYQGTTLAEGESHDNTALRPHAPTITYRLPGYDGLNKAQRVVILSKASQEQMGKSIQQGADQLMRSVSEYVSPTFHDDPGWFLKTSLQAAQSEVRKLDRPQAIWTWMQVKGALQRFIDLETPKPYMKRSLFGLRSNEIRSDPIKMINTQGSSQNSTADFSAEFSEALNAFNQLQANISNQLFPVLNDLITGSNNSIVYQMALSIYSDITLSTQQLIGPFKSGMTAFTYIEQLAANRTNITIFSNGTLDLGEQRTDMKCMLALHSIYEELYLSTWEKAIKATNSTGSLSDLATLNSYLLPKDTSIYPPGWANTTTSFLDSPDFRALAVYANLTEPANSNGTKGG